MSSIDHVLTKLSSLQDMVTAGSITATDIVSRLDYIAAIVEEMEA
jgi:hypothetical protein